MTKRSQFSTCHTRYSTHVAGNPEALNASMNQHQSSNRTRLSLPANVAIVMSLLVVLLAILASFVAYSITINAYRNVRVQTALNQVESMRMIASNSRGVDGAPLSPEQVSTMLAGFMERQAVDRVQQAACLVNHETNTILPIQLPETVRFATHPTPMTTSWESEVFGEILVLAGRSSWSGDLEIRSRQLVAIMMPAPQTDWSIALALSDDDIRAVGMGLVRPFFLALWIGLGFLVPLAIYALHRSYTRVHHALVVAERDVRVQGDRVRRQVGQDLHDDLGNLLTGASYMAKSLETTLERRKDDAAGDAREVTMRIAEAIEGVRRCAKGLHPVEPGPDGVVRALESLAADVFETSHVNCLVEAKPNVRITNPDVAMQVYLIAQSSIGNSIAHGKASRITVRLDSRADDRYVLEVEDDGLGLDARDEAVYTGMGLSNVQHRAMMIRGHLSLNQSRAGGVLVRCHFEKGLAESEDDAGTTDA